MNGTTLDVPGAQAFFASDVRVAKRMNGEPLTPTEGTIMNTLKLDRQLEDTTRAPTHQQIQARAYELYLARGEVPGHEQEDWLAAERELTDAVSADAFTNEGGAPPEGKARVRETSRSNRGQGDRASSSQRH